MFFPQLDEAMKLIMKASGEMKQIDWDALKMEDMAAADQAREEFDNKMDKLATLVKSVQDGTAGGRRRKSRKVTRRVAHRRSK